MFSVERSVPINAGLAPGEPALTRRHVWLGLVLKAEDAVPFVPAMSYCHVTGRFDNGLFRDIVFHGEAMTEKILFHPEEKVEFIRTAGIEMGTIVNEILEDEDGRAASALRVHPGARGDGARQRGGEGVRRRDGEGVPGGGAGDGGRDQEAG